MKRSHVKMLGIGAAALLTSVIGLSRLPAPSIAADATKETCQPAMLHAGEMKWMDTPALAKGLQVAILYGDLKKAEPVGFRIKLPAGGIMAPHTHPVVERVTVISGTFAMGHGETSTSRSSGNFRSGASPSSQQAVRCSASRKTRRLSR
jgi:hypothetical protein